MPSQNFLILFLGHPGSGKTYFSKQLAQEIGAVRINGDAMRKAMFGSFQKAREANQKEPINPLVFGALTYAAEQVLVSGQSVVYDVQHNQRHFRADLANIAKKHQAAPIIVWVKTPFDVALERGHTREETDDQQQHHKEKMEAVIKKHQAALEPPTANEFCIEIDGTVPFSQQYNDYKRQLALL